MSGEEAPSGGVGRFFGAIMIVAGIFILTASGLCSAYFVGTMIVQPMIEHGPFVVTDHVADHDVALMIFVGIFFAGVFGAGVGLFLWIVGRNLRPKL